MISDRVMVALMLILTLITAWVWVQAKDARTENQRLARELQAQTQARNNAEWLLHSQTQTMAVFATIRAANRAARLEDEEERHEAQKTITAAVATDECASRPVPDAAAERLRRLDARTRAAGRGGSATGGQ